MFMFYVILGIRYEIGLPDARSHKNGLSLIAPVVVQIPIEQNGIDIRDRAVLRYTNANQACHQDDGTGSVKTMIAVDQNVKTELETRTMVPVNLKQKRLTFAH